MLFLFKKPLLIPTMMVLVMVSTCLYLGSWQVKRLAYKQELLAQIEENYFALPVDIDQLGEGISPFLHIKMQGQFLSDYQIFIASKMHQGELGYYVFMPFKTNQENLFWVNLGWVPLSVKPDDIVKNARSFALTGHVYYPDKKRSAFVPENPQSIGIETPWYSYDLKAMNIQTKLDAATDHVIFLDAQNPDLLPIPGQLDISIRNNHLEYLITWFGFAIIFVLMYAIYVRQFLNKRASKS